MNPLYFLVSTLLIFDIYHHGLVGNNLIKIYNYSNVGTMTEFRMKFIILFVCLVFELILQIECQGKFIIVQSGYTIIKSFDRPDLIGFYLLPNISYKLD